MKSKKKIRESNIKKIKELISAYFCKTGLESFKLPILDTPNGLKSIESAEEDEDNPYYDDSYYTGVTLTYIMKYIIKYKYKKDLVIYSLFDMLDNEEIKSLHCPTIGKVVFENNNTDHWTYRVLKTPKRDHFANIAEALPKEFCTYIGIKKLL